VSDKLGSYCNAGGLQQCAGRALCEDGDASSSS